MSYHKLYSSCSGNDSSLLSSYKFSYPYLNDPLPSNPDRVSTGVVCSRNSYPDIPDIINQNCLIPKQSCSRNGVCGSISGSKGLLPILEPEFNFRETVKQLILLEDHLTQVLKRCLDCILKHFLAIEGFLEEAKTLDVNGRYNLLITQKIFETQRLYRLFFENYNNVTDEDCLQISQDLRKMRKDLMPYVKDFKV